MPRFQLHHWLLALFLLLLPVSLHAASQPNIVFILTDDQGYGDLSCHGHPLLKTPNIDRLHAESVRFTDFQVSPICSPTRCALMTGRHEYRSGVCQTRGPGQNMSLDATTLAQVLKSAGYSTGLFGKWHLGADEPYRPYKRGFDMTLSFSSGMIGEGQPGGSLFDSKLWRNGETEKTSGFCTDVFFEEATKWIASVKSEGPFFCYIPTNAPHTPVGCPDEFLEPYKDSAPTEELAAYFGMIANLDANVGRLMDQLEAWNLEQNTVVIFMSDNGANGHFKTKPSPPQFYNAGMKGAKSSVDEGGTRVPSFWRLPGRFPAGVDVERLAGAIDVFPTLAELAGAKLPASLDLDGRSLLPLLRDAQADWPDRLLFIHASNWGGPPADQADRGFAVRNERFRLVSGLLFDVKADRGQSADVAGENAEAATSLRAAYDAWWQEVQPVLESSLGRSESSAESGGKKKRKQAEPDEE
jgi:arylsulfatase